VVCQKSEQEVDNHFVQMDKMVRIGSGAERNIFDLDLSRYACYLIMQNADPKKEVFALLLLIFFFCLQAIVLSLCLKKN